MIQLTLDLHLGSGVPITLKKKNPQKAIVKNSVSDILTYFNTEHIITYVDWLACSQRDLNNNK